MLLKTQLVNNKIGKFKCLMPNDNGDTTMQHLYGVAKAALRWKFIMIQTFLKKTENPK